MTGVGSETLVRTLADLTALRRWRSPPRVTALRLDLPGLGDDEARATATRLVSLQRECGCAMGALFAYPTAAVVVVWQVARPPAWATQLGIRIGVSLAIVIVAGVAGKLLGIGNARLTLRRELTALIERAQRAPR